MKGLSLAIETVVILIVAVVILGILTYFLITNSAGLDVINKQRVAAELCGRYVQLGDLECRGTKLRNFPQRDELGTTCKELEYPGCIGGLNSQCLKACCNICIK